MVVLRVLAVVAGAVVVAATVLSALRTVVLPRGTSVWLSRQVFVFIRKLFDLRLRMLSTYEARDRVMALYAPLALAALPAVWVALVLAGFTAAYWGFGVDSWRTAFATSGSAVTTLGFAAPSDLPTTALAVTEAVIGLGLVALLISYLPSIYASFQRRELAVGLLEVRAGDPPSALEMIRRHHRIGWLERSDALFAEWEQWFADVEETHTSFPALVFFRSPLAGRSWITAAGAVLDAAALMSSTVAVDGMPQAQLCLRSGYLALGRIADFFAIPHDPDPAPGDPITIDRVEFDEVCGHLADAGVPLRADLDQAWRDFAGWRVNYDQVLVTLAGFTMAPYAPWSSDRSVRFRVPALQGAGRLRGEPLRRRRSGGAREGGPGR